MSAANAFAKDAVLGTVVILNHNAGEMTCHTLKALRRQTIAEQLHVIVVDNGSTDNSVDLLAGRYPDLHLIRNPENLGFAGGNNSAFPYCRGPYVLLLNNDAIPEPKWAEELLRAARSHPGAGMCTSRIYVGNERTRFDNTGHMIFVDGMSRSRGHMEADRGQYDREEEVLFASGCAALYLREPLLQVGGFDEDFFAYGDDTDLGLKFRLLGYRCWYVPSAIVFHQQSQTLGKNSLKKIFLIERNRIWVLIKYLPLLWILKSPIYTGLRLLLSGKAASRGEGLAGELGQAHSLPKIGLTILSAWLQALLKLPAMLGKRKALRRLRVLDDNAWEKLLASYRASLDDMSFRR